MRKIFHAFGPALLMILLLVVFQGNTQIVINEFSASNVSSFPDSFGEYPDWVELYNMGSSAVSLNGYYLSDDSSEVTKWQFPASVSIPANGFLRVWASGRDSITPGQPHTNFKLSQTKSNPEVILLADPSGNILDIRSLAITQAGHSNGRTTNGASTWSVFTSPSPGASNNNAAPYLRYTAKPTVGTPAGFYTSGLTIEVTNHEPNSKLRYTLDGADPTATSPELNGPAIISSTSVLKVRAFSNNSQILPGLIEFNTYFLNESTTLPIMSFGASNLTQLLNGNELLKPVGSMEYFSPDGVRITSSYGEFDKHGQDSWVHPQRSMDIRSRDDYGYNNGMQETFFHTTDRDEFQRLIIRACGDDNYPGIDSSAHLRDDFVQSLSERSGQSLDWRKSARCLVFANGQYWGVYSIREKVDDADYCEYYYGQDRYKLQFLMYWGGLWAEYGGQKAISDFNSLKSYIMTHDMSNPQYYDYVQQRYDVTSLADYMIINSFVVCSDWLNWNVGWWRGLDSAGLHKKWAYILWDEDATFNHYINYTAVPAQSPTVSPCYHESLNNSFSDPQGHVSILLKLKANPGFNQFYINRYVDLMNTTFKPSYCLPFLDSMAAIIAPEMPRHFTRWGGNLTKWQSNVQKIKDFITIRYNSLSSGLINCYNLTGPYPITVDVEPAGAGKVQVNSIIPDGFPWSGDYFGNIPVKFAAVASNSEYTFDHWEVQNHAITPSATAEVITMNLVQSDMIKAVFVPKTSDDSLVINEINYNSANDFEPGDWVELFNPQSYTINAEGWVFKDEDDAHIFTIPADITIPGLGFLVLAEDMDKFKALFPDVQNVVGPTGFGFAGGGELLRLYAPNGLLVDTVHYDDVAPWPTEPDGNGPTLELKNPYLDNALAQNWIACDGHGTPGKTNCVMPGLSDNPEIGGQCSVFPNPVQTLAQVAISPEYQGQTADVFVYNQLGKLVSKAQSGVEENLTFSVDDLKNGIYFYLINVNGQQVCRGKILVLQNH